MAGRTEKPISDGPGKPLAGRLRRYRNQVGRPPYREMAERIGRAYTHTALARAANGRAFPTWPLTRAYLCALGADEEELDRWKAVYDRLRLDLREKLRNAASPARSAGDRNELGEQHLTIAPSAPAATGSLTLRPGTVRTFGDLIAELQALYVAVGRPPYASLCRRGLATSTVADVLAGKHFPREETFNRLVQALLWDRRLHDGQLRAWQHAWVAVSMNRSRTLSTNHQANVVPFPEVQPSVQEAAALGAMTARAAAEMLGRMAPADAAALLTDVHHQHPRAAAAIMIEMTSAKEPIELA